MNSQTPRQIVTKQFARVLELLERDVQSSVPIALIIGSSRELLNVGEEGIAFENMVENLYENDFPLQKHMYGEIETLGHLLHIAPNVWKPLATLIVDK